MTHASGHDGRHDFSAADEPRILPMPTPRGTAIRDLLEPIIAAQAAATAVSGGRVRVTLDVPAGQFVDAEKEAVRGLLEGLVAAAFAAAVHPAQTDGPSLREVVVTGIDAADAVELEIADSGALHADDRSLTACHELARRCGAAITVNPCPEGGTAVTVRLGRRRARRQAA